jgi:acyl-CoA hydrolase
MYPMVFGGAFFSELDLAAASCVNRLLHESECDSAVTHKFSGTFHAPSYAGDIIFIDAKIAELRHKAVVVNVIAFREPRSKGDGQKPVKQLVATAEFIFVTRKGEEYANHNLTLE